MQVSEQFFYYKSVLRKVSFDNALFYKEYHKAISTLPAAERQKLQRWALRYATRSPHLFPVTL